MALVRWEPARELHALQHEVNRLFGSFFDAPTSGATANGVTARHWMPAMDLVETKHGYVLRADLPGLTDADVNVEVEDNVLTISGERRTEQTQEREGFYRIERASGQFSRSLTLPDGIDAERIAAAFENGVLEVRVPKPAARKPQRVAIGVTRPAEPVAAGEGEHPGDGPSLPTAA